MMFKCAVYVKGPVTSVFENIYWHVCLLLYTVDVETQKHTRGCTSRCAMANLNTMMMVIPACHSNVSSNKLLETFSKFIIFVILTYV